MEHRRGRRKRVQMHAVVRYEELGLFSGRVRDIGTGGMGIETGPIVIPRDARVEVHFRFPGDDQAGYALAAAIAWTAHGEMGLAFQEPAPEVMQKLYAELYGARAGSARGFSKRFHG
ncbi:PilZ domain-containing protein [Thiohalomonas denitrificans]|uniref:PilZ domain-containing protein n=1 Tax=Thiohalomonas denitrificans TaxID=415747 RepID=UPI0026EE7A5C|nr:PilZ domain-containing protein [Thiohalomonas denitrificans]